MISLKQKSVDDLKAGLEALQNEIDFIEKTYDRLPQELISRFKPLVSLRNNIEQVLLLTAIER